MPALLCTGVGRQRERATPVTLPADEGEGALNVNVHRLPAFLAAEGKALGAAGAGCSASQKLVLC